MITGMKKTVLVHRTNSFGYYEQEQDTKNAEEINKAIKEKEDNRYFDKYGNEFKIEELTK